LYNAKQDDNDVSELRVRDSEVCLDW